MNTHWITLQSIPAGGKTLVLEDQAYWRDPMEEFGIPGRIVEALRAEIFILPQEQGVLFRGSITGVVALPCDRCADESLITLRHSFDSFEIYPSDPLAGLTRNAAEKALSRKNGRQPDREAEDLAEDADTDASVIRLAAHGRGLEVNPGALVWEEFSLALPVKPLCGENCKGLCPGCGCNRNRESCNCVSSGGDPRLAALRGLTITKK